MAEDKKKGTQAKGADEKKKKVKRPSALKRDIQAKRRNDKNRSFKSTVKSATLSLDTSLKNKETKEQVQSKLDALYSLMDKGVKKKIFKQNKADRTKARFFTRSQATA